VNVWPVVERGLGSVARKPATHRLRVWISTAGLAGVVGLLLFSPVSDVERGRQLYIMVSGLALLWAMAVGVLFTADAINEERARGTLGLLFLTDLGPGDILLGKLVARSLNGTYALISLLPLLAVPLTFGGVMVWQLMGHTVLILETLVLSMTVRGIDLTPPTPTAWGVRWC
jgi:ABC-type transport system involved in multi-copper enzyme maturation permease subunit